MPIKKYFILIFVPEIRDIWKMEYIEGVPFFALLLTLYLRRLTFTRIREL